jgi:hypothetical protein
VGTGDGTIAHGTGTWDTTATNGVWTTDAGANNIAWTNGNDAIFGGGTLDTAGTVTIQAGKGLHFLGDTQEAKLMQMMRSGDGLYPNPAD